MTKFDQTDLFFTYGGDYDIDANGDLRDTSNTFGRAIVQEVRNRLTSKRGEWRLEPSIGSDVQDLLGEANTEGLTQEIASEVVRSLTFDRFLNAGEFEIIPLRLTDAILLFRIVIFTSVGELNATIGYDSNHQRFIGY